MLTFLSHVCVVYLMCESVDFLKIYDSLCGPSPCKMPSPWMHSRSSQSELGWFVARSWDSMSLSLFFFLHGVICHFWLLQMFFFFYTNSWTLMGVLWQWHLCLVYYYTHTSILLDHVIMDSYVFKNLHCFLQVYVSIEQSNSHINKYKRSSNSQKQYLYYIIIPIQRRHKYRNIYY